MPSATGSRRSEYDPKEPEWVFVAKVEPYLDRNKTGTTVEIFYIGVGEIIGAFEEINASIWWGELDLFPMTPKRLEQFKSVGSSRDEAFVKLYLAQHRVLHRWLDLTLSVGEFVKGSGVAAYIEAYRSLERKLGTDYEETSQSEEPDQFVPKIREHNREHRIFQLWCVFREAALRLKLGQDLTMWLINDLGHLAAQAHPSLVVRPGTTLVVPPGAGDPADPEPVVKRDKKGRAAVVARLTRGMSNTGRRLKPTDLKLGYANKGPTTWAVDILDRATRKGANADISIDLCRRCQRQLDEHGQGRPSQYCRDCRPIARREKDRERKKAKRQ